MSSTVFRAQTPQPTTPQKGLEAPADKGVPRGTTEVEPPFMDYAKEKGHSYVLDHYDVHTPNMGEITDSRIFEEEVGAIERYLQYQIQLGEVNNTVDSVKNELKRIEKMINVKKDARASMRISLVAEYANFLLKSDNIKKESAKYGLM